MGGPTSLGNAAGASRATGQTTQKRLVTPHALLGALLACLCAVAACAGDVRMPPPPTWAILERVAKSSVDKMDILLVIDNSRSMSDKQMILRSAVSDLVEKLTNPPCVDPLGNPAESQPTDPLADCPVGTDRAYQPLFDIHIGVISSSIGGHGADACDGLAFPSENDKAHLLARSGTEPGDPVVSTWQKKGFLVWDPSTLPTHEPQGETDAGTLISHLEDMVGGVGEVGCGFEATLEAWYRFLVDPDPYESIAIEKNEAVLLGTDTVLLQQRADFLRSSSMLVIIMLSDENDCSIRDGGMFYFASQIYAPGTNQPYHLPKPRAACASDPNSECCRSCGQSPAPGCDFSQDDCNTPLGALDDSLNLRCFDQKRRFGIDFLWPIDRYSTGLTSSTVQDRHGNLVPNTLFTDLNPNDNDSIVRDPGLVFIAGIVGVPWQDIARKNPGPDGTPNTADDYPDLLEGLDSSGSPSGGLQSAAELVQNGIWDIILGDPSSYKIPSDPLMIESIDPRSGVNPVTGDAVQPPSAGELANPINGHEYSIPNRNDLQYACIFPLPAPRDCTDPGQTACDCQQVDNDKPLCDPLDKQSQKYAKAYPGIRQLQLLKAVGSQGIVASICPEQQGQQALPNFGYRPAMGAISKRLQSAVDGGCFPYALPVDAEGQVSCHILEARQTGAPCDCSIDGRKSPSEPSLVEAVMADSTNPGWNCICELEQLAGDALHACHSDPAMTPVVSGQAVHGWCYIDAMTDPPTGDPSFVAQCPASEQRLIRFVGDGAFWGNATLFLGCTE